MKASDSTQPSASQNLRQASQARVQSKRRGAILIWTACRLHVLAVPLGSDRKPFHTDVSKPISLAMQPVIRTVRSCWLSGRTRLVHCFFWSSGAPELSPMKGPAALTAQLIILTRGCQHLSALHVYNFRQKGCWELVPRADQRPVSA